MRNKPSLLVRVSGAIGLASLICFFLYPGLVKNGSQTVIDHILLGTVTVAFTIASAATFIDFLGNRRVRNASGKTDESSETRADNRPLRMAGIGLAIIVLSIAIVVVSAYLRWAFPRLLPGLLQGAVISSVGAAMAMVGIFFVVQAITNALRR